MAYRYAEVEFVLEYLTWLVSFDLIGENNQSHTSIGLISHLIVARQYREPFLVKHQPVLGVQMSGKDFYVMMSVVTVCTDQGVDSLHMCISCGSVSV